jgi:hypothetical protein
MVILEYLHFILMIVCAQWLVGPATEKVQFGVVVAVLIEIHTAQRLAKRHELTLMFLELKIDLNCLLNILF